MALFLYTHIILFFIALIINPSDMIDTGIAWGIFIPFFGTGSFIYSIINAICSIFDKYNLGNYNFDSICSQAATGKIDVVTSTGVESPYNPFSLSYEQFTKFYLINPVKWRLKDNKYLIYLPEDDYSDKHYIANFYSGKEYKKAVKYYLDCQERGKKSGSVFAVDSTIKKNTAEVLKDIQQDIDRLQTQADLEIIEANNRTQEISLRLNN